MPSDPRRVLEAGQMLITTDFVVEETLTLIRFRLGLPVLNASWQQIDGSAGCEGTRRQRSFRTHVVAIPPLRNKDLSFTDRTSLAVMRELRLTTMLTTNHHFQHVGFDVLPAAPSGRKRKPRRPRWFAQSRSRETAEC